MRLPDQLPVKVNMELLLLDEPSATSVPLHPPTRAQVLADEAGAREFVRAWQAWQPAEEVEWATRSWAGLGKQDVPVRVTLSGWDRIAEVAGRAGEVALARERFAVLVELFPGWPEFRERAARSWSSWSVLSEDDFSRLCLALRWFHVKPSSGLRARAVPIEGLDTKWIAAHRGLLQRLLGVADLGLAEGDRLMRVRFLDGALAPAPGLLDAAVPFGSLALPDGLVVIVVENKETFLALPQAPEGSGAVLVWGSGYTASALPELPWVRRARIQEEWQLPEKEFRDLVNAGALDLIVDTVEAGATPDEARAWWVSYINGKANEAGTDLDALGVTPADVARVVELVKDGKLTTKLGRQAIDGVIAGEGTVDEVVAARGLEVVRDDGAIEKAVDEALAAQPDIAEKIRAGKTKAAGAIVGAVMKATRGQADAARVQELVLERCH